MAADQLKKRRKPSFFKALTNQNLSSRVKIPATFVKKYGKCLSTKMMLRNYQNEFWKVEVAKVGTSSYFREGWETFVKDNKLELGDFVLFKYSCTSTFKFKMYGKTRCEKKFERSHELVGICNENQQEVENDAQNGERNVIIVDSDDHGHSGQSKHSLHKRKREEREMQFDNGINFDSAYPFFHVDLRSTYVSSYLAVPIAFFKDVVKMGTHKIKLEVNEKMWNVDLKMHYRSKSKKWAEARFSAGWIQFVRENNLKERDVCIFEMLKTDPSLFFRVHIKIKVASTVFRGI